MAKDEMRLTATCCNTPQHTALHCNTLQQGDMAEVDTSLTATHGNTRQHTATHCNTRRHTATNCNILQHIATGRHGRGRKVACSNLETRTPSSTPIWSRRRLRALRMSMLQCVAECCRVLQCVAVCCSALQCVAVRCSALQCVAVSHFSF